jgi:hypothetical protein
MEGVLFADDSPCSRRSIVYLARPDQCVSGIMPFIWGSIAVLEEVVESSIDWRFNVVDLYFGFGRAGEFICE